MSDFQFIDHGSIVQFTPLTPHAKQWLKDNVAADGWQWLGNSLCADSRAGYALLEELENADECFDIEEA